MVSRALAAAWRSGAALWHQRNASGKRTHATPKWDEEIWRLHDPTHAQRSNSAAKALNQLL